MNIPKKLKVGGITYKIEVTDKLKNGTESYMGEIDFRELAIRIQPNSKERQQATLMHEIIHAVYSFIGYDEHDEKQISELANALLMIIKDNPKVFGGLKWKD